MSGGVMHHVKFGRHTMKLPGSRLARMLLGIGLVLGGFLWFLPIVGFWMLPLGIAVLAVDIPFVDRWWSRTQPRLEAWMARTFPALWDKAFAEKDVASKDDPAQGLVKQPADDQRK